MSKSNNRVSLFSEIIEEHGGDVVAVKDPSLLLKKLAVSRTKKVVVIEVIYDGIAVTNRDKWKKAGFAPPKFVTGTPVQAREQLRMIMALGRKVVVSLNMGVVDEIYPALKLNMALAELAWNGKMDSAVGEDEFATEVSLKQKRIQRAIEARAKVAAAESE